MSEDIETSERQLLVQLIEGLFGERADAAFRDELIERLTAYSPTRRDTTIFMMAQTRINVALVNIVSFLSAERHQDALQAQQEMLRLVELQSAQAFEIFNRLILSDDADKTR